jgi:hypothetical protein
MSKPLTEKQIRAIESAALDSFKFENDAIRAALVRLEFLEQKVVAAELLAVSITSDTIRFYDNNESARTMHLREECGSGHCGYCSEARQPYLATGPALAAYNEVKQ